MMEDYSKKIIEEFQSGNVDKQLPYHVHNGIDSPLIESSSSVAGNDKNIQYNDGGVLAGDDNLQWDKTTKSIIFPSNTTSSIIGSSGTGTEDGGAIDIAAGDGGDTSGDGGNVSINAGDGSITAGNGGVITIKAGNSPNDYTAGEVDINAGNGGQGGWIRLLAGGSDINTVKGGDVTIQSGDGDGTGADGGDIIIYLGIGTSNRGRLNITGLPTSSAGLSTGDVWIDTTGGANYLKIVT